jgi:Fe2+ transport system protein FeoA
VAGAGTRVAQVTLLVRGQHNGSTAMRMLRNLGFKRSSQINETNECMTNRDPIRRRSCQLLFPSLQEAKFKRHSATQTIV